MGKLWISTRVVWLVAVLGQFENGVCFDIFQGNRMYVYNFTGSVEAGARNEEATVKPTSWEITGLFQLQRIDSTTVAGWIIPHGEVKFRPTKTGSESVMRMAYNEHIRSPFKILTGNGAINYVALGKEPLWISNIKRSFASSFQIQVHNFGLFKVTEGSIHGFCEMDYLVTNKTSHYHIRKTVNLNSCSPHPDGIHYVRSNIPRIPCTSSSTMRKIIVSNDATYELKPHAVQGVYVTKVVMRGSTMVNIFESTGSAQYIVSRLEFNHLKDKPLPSNNLVEFSFEGNSLLTSLEYVSHRTDPTGGRATPTNEQYIAQIIYLLNYLTDNLETTDTINFKEPIDSHVSEMFRLLSLMNLETMTTFFQHIDKGTSYRQETIRNIFLEILPRIGTAASVYLTRDIIVKQQVKSTTAVQLLISLPFHIDDLSLKLVQECEAFLNLGSISPDVRQAGVLTFSILVHNTYMAGKMSTDEFERYVKRFFDYFLASVDYEQQMLYINAMGNLQQGNVAEYLDPIITTTDYSTDVRFLAIMSILPTAESRPEKSYEVYWPIFESSQSPLQLRIAAFIILLHSNPTPARLMAIHDFMQTVTCPHLRNFYVTTLQSLKKTTYPCYRKLKEVVGFISRHLPKADTRFWSTGNYLFDYIHESGIGGLFGAMLISDDDMMNIPHIIMTSIKTEALGKYTGQLQLYLKVRGVTDMFYKKQMMNFGSSGLGLADILQNIKLNTIPDTPLHLELILQMEGKAVLSFYLNQTSFDTLPQGELTSRLAAILLGDTHINMQSFRWPFVNKYSVPTVLGTPAEVLIETTVATTVRGNITNVLKELRRNQQIDMRYSSYSQCQTMVYNPFLNLEHQIKQEQGFLGYLPINLELQFNMEKNNVEMALILPKNNSMGFALKSRLATGIYEFLLLGENSKNRSQIFEEWQTDLPISVFNHQIQELGLNFEFDIGYKGLYRNVFNPTENWFVEKNLGGLDENGHTRFIGNYILQLINIGQVSATHLGNNKYVKGVISSQEDCRLVWKLEKQSTTDGPDFEVTTFELGLEHYNSLKIPEEDKTPNHKWNGMVKIKSHNSRKTVTTQLVFKRVNRGSSEWRMCLENTYGPLILMKQPEQFEMTVVFGNMEPGSTKKCPDQSKLKITGSFNIHQDVEEIMGTIIDAEVDERCPKNSIYFNPPITNLNCERFDSLTKVTNYHLNITAQDMPDLYTMWMRRLEQLYSSVTTGSKPNQGWENRLNVTVTSSAGQRFKNLSINGISTEVLDIANIFDSDHDVKYHTMARMFEDYGFLHSCSVMGDTLLGYNGFRANLSEHRVNRTNCGILLAADCSPKKSFAVFVEPVEGFEMRDKFAIRIFVGDNSFLFSPNAKESVTFEEMGTPNSKKVINLRNWHQEEEMAQFVKFYFTEENILIVDHKVFETKIQFMDNLLQISTKFWLQNKICGICSRSSVRNAPQTHCFE